MTDYTDEDMAAVGRALMDAIDANINDPWLKGWAPAQCPSEIVGDLLAKLDELAGDGKTDSPKGSAEGEARANAKAEGA